MRKRIKLPPRPDTMSIGGNPATIAIIALRSYSWSIRVRGRDRTGAAKSPEDAIDLMRDIVKPKKKDERR